MHINNCSGTGVNKYNKKKKNMQIMLWDYKRPKNKNDKKHL